MKLFYFVPSSYGSEYFVMAESEEEAIEFLNKYLQEEHVKRLTYYHYHTKPDHKYYFPPKLQIWGDDTFKGYTIEVHERGQVVETEIS